MVDLLVHLAQEPPRHRLVLDRAVPQRLHQRLDRGERRAQLVRDVGDEVAPRRLQPSQLGQVVQHQQRQRLGHAPHRGGGGAQRPAPRAELDLGGPRPVVAQHPVDQRGQLVVARDRDERPAEHVVLGRRAEQPLRRAIGQDDPAVRVDHQQAVPHRLQDGRQLAALLRDERDRLLQLVGHPVERPPELPDLVGRARPAAQVEPPGGHRAGERPQVVDRPRDVARQQERQAHRQEATDRDAAEDHVAQAAELRIDLPQVPRHAGHADRPPVDRDRRRDVEVVAAGGGALTRAVPRA